MDAVCFDMDGVLVDSEDYWVALEEEGILPAVAPGQSVDTAEITGMNYREIYDYLAREYDVALSKAEFVERYDDAARELYGERVALVDGLHDLLAALRNRGVALAVVSSSPPDWIDLVLDRFDLRNEFDAVVSADTLDAPGKPQPHVYRHAAKELGVDPENCLAVEDSEHGIESASRAGMTVVGFRWGSEKEGDRSGADVEAATPDELRERVLAAVDG